MEPITWKAPEFEWHQKPKGWYVALWILAAALCVVAIITDSIMMLVLVVVGAGVVSLYGAKRPPVLDFSLTEKILTVGKKDHHVEDFESFWIFERSDHSLVSIDIKGFFQPHLKIIVPPDKVGRVRRILSEKLEEIEQEESLAEELADRFKF